MARYAISYRVEAVKHMRTTDAKHYGLIRAAIDDRLGHEPLVEDRNRKPLRASPSGTGLWELRFGPGNRFRAFYRADDEARTVAIVAIGLKTGNRFFFGGEERKV